MTTTAIVYVGKNEYPFRGMLMSHMACADVSALHAMADRIGLDRKWFRDKPAHPHYDISKSKKALALSLGAVEVSDKELIRNCYPAPAAWMDKPGEKP